MYKLKFDKKTLLLYAITDRSWLGGQTLYEQVEQALQGGATFLQLREKHLDDDAFLQLAHEIKVLTDRFRIPFVINDNVDVAIACNADGVHVGQTDMYSQNVRQKIGPDKILGVSTQTVEQAMEAEKNGADYLGVGAMFATDTKEGATLVTVERLKEICRAVSIPVVAIGGINASNVLRLKGSGIAGISVISAIFAQPDIFRATKQLYDLAKQTVAMGK